MLARLQECWFLSGPTASGKSAVANDLARRIGGEILSLDSMAVYRGLDIGTAKPPAAERQAVPHHLLDLVEPTEDFSVAQYIDAAERAVLEVLDRGRRPLFVGGSPLYLKALLRGLFDGPPADWDFRGELAEIARREGSAALHAQLAAVDLAAANRLHPNDTRRLIRALEVYHHTGQPISSMQTQFTAAGESGRRQVFVLDWPREQLHRRINDRVDAMFAAGWLDEARQFVDSGRALSRTASQAVGYRELLEHLAGERGFAETAELIKTRTRQFAKRQLTWLRSLTECRWIAVEQRIDPAAVAERIVVAAASGLQPARGGG
ncbi:MAG TPA: tRNA (adenosine(37)-N6)-dimethylallyltransferase MiaA [Pirellulales bacterium]|jgi:tRNA dimethylallyltransferase|nr:tRNA (adenosine(37)-N6)-dimethylallyltransferase MiaA [Pirellulales bacterium]